jgi:uncharacterized membrane protein YkgB
MQTTFNSFYFQFSSKMEKHSINLMRIALSLVYIWFGALKIVGMSPAGELVKETVYWFKPEIFIPILGICEVFIGLGLLIRKWVPFAVILLLLHMIATFFPIVILNSNCFDAFPYCPTLVGQYIIKNVVLASGALVIAGNYKSNKVESL